MKARLDAGTEADITLGRPGDGGFHVDDQTPLLWASQCGHTEIVALLLKAGAKVNRSHVSGNGFTPLTVAAHGGHAAVVEALLKAGGEVDRPNTNGSAA